MELIGSEFERIELLNWRIACPRGRWTVFVEEGPRRDARVFAMLVMV